MQQIAIHTTVITLSALLKWAGIVETGGQAKELITTGKVHVNGEIEYRKGRQLRAGDRIDGPHGVHLVIVKASDAASPANHATHVS